MEVRQKSKLEEMERRKVEDRRRRERENAAGMREARNSGSRDSDENQVKLMLQSEDNVMNTADASEIRERQTKTEISVWRRGK